MGAPIKTEKNPFKCEQCDKSFEYQSRLRKHIKIYHDKIRDQICQHCNMAFFTLSHLNRHIKFKHEKGPFTNHVETIFSPPCFLQNIINQNLLEF